MHATASRMASYFLPPTDAANTTSGPVQRVRTQNSETGSSHVYASTSRPAAARGIFELIALVPKLCMTSSAAIGEDRR